ncbi:hypothetical protein ACFPK1_00550 [Actinomycetospora rhizophila]|uniref:Uncharacterized protein n=1 Tax=Actinomycetospora rhizophila TaxID=1416876 RepID=A0ABV9ZB59_9PSEU
MTVHVDVESTGFRLRFSGIDLVTGGRRELFVPFERVLGTRVLTRADAVASSPHLACPGWSWLRRARVGSWGIGERRQLWSVRRGGRVVVVYLSGRPFHRVVVEVEDPEGAYRRLDAALLHSKRVGARRSLRHPGADHGEPGTSSGRRGAREA